MAVRLEVMKKEWLCRRSEYKKTTIKEEYKIITITTTNHNLNQ